MTNVLKILIIGKNGQLGWELSTQLKNTSYEYRATDYPEFDITNESCINNFLEKDHYSIVINASGYTEVDKAEEDVENAYKVNSRGPELLAKACAEKDIALFHLSTDYVFDGESDEEYREDDQTNPIGVYGQSKFEGEEKVRTTIEKHIIIRTAWLYGNHGNNFVKTMLRLGQEKKELGIVADQEGCPTYARDLAAAIIAITDQILVNITVEWGTYHYCGKGATSWFEFAKEIFSQAVKLANYESPILNSLTSKEYKTLAKRPKNSTLNCDKIHTNFGVKIQPWKKSLSQMLKLQFS